jgi:predicted CXXCH cytochrome family protein
MRSVRASYSGMSLWVALASVPVLLCGCDKVDRHNMLTFFFDGVPPVGSETAGVGLADPNTVPGPRVSPTGGWYVHKPLNNCTDCHGDRRRQTTSRQVQLVAEIPKLCYGCHEEQASLEGWVHGPVATGDCLLCHEPHKSRNEFLLAKPVPALCYDCHEPQTVHQIEGHADESHTYCIGCHDGHAGATRHLLKPEFLEKPAAASYLAHARRVQYEEAVRRARGDLKRRNSLPAMLETAIGHLETGRLWAARAYLEALMECDDLNDREKTGVADVLKQVIALSRTPAPDAPGAGALVAALRAIRDQRGERQQAIADRYYSSIKLYHAGRFAEARSGFLEVLADRSVPEPMREMANDYLKKIEWVQKESFLPGWQPLRE